MGHIVYQRPREKLLEKGVASLSMLELIQILIGSGTARQSVTKIARGVERIIKTQGASVSLADLTVIPGLGSVKAGQILATFELATRLAGVKEDVGEYKHTVADIYSDIRSSKVATLFYVFFDGNGRLLSDGTYVLDTNEKPVNYVRKVFAEALSYSTASVILGVGWSSQSLEPSLNDLELARDAHSLSSTLSIPIKKCVLLSSRGEYAMKEARRG